jgi:hypothetical protein
MKSRISGVVATLALALLLIGCAPTDSLFPLYKPDEAVFDNHLLGTWQPVITDANAADKDQRWLFSHSEGHSYYDFKWGAAGATSCLSAMELPNGGEAIAFLQNGD